MISAQKRRTKRIATHSVVQQHLKLMMIFLKVKQDWITTCKSCMFKIFVRTYRMMLPESKTTIEFFIAIFLKIILIQADANITIFLSCRYIFCNKKDLLRTFMRPLKILRPWMRHLMDVKTMLCSRKFNW